MQNRVLIGLAAMQRHFLHPEHACVAILCTRVFPSCASVVRDSL